MARVHYPSPMELANAAVDKLRTADRDALATVVIWLKLLAQDDLDRRINTLHGRNLPGSDVAVVYARISHMISSVAGLTNGDIDRVIYEIRDLPL